MTGISMVTNNKSGYGWKIAFAYVFNLIFGSGALALPKAFARTGWLLGLVSFSILAMISYCTATFMIEVMSIANAMLRYGTIKSESKEVVYGKDNVSLKISEERKPLIEKEENPYEISIKLEMADLSGMFFHKAGQFIYYVVICIYLYGGMASYAIIVSKSLAAIACGGNETISGKANPPCDNIKYVNIRQMYQIFLSIFAATLCPFVFFNISKTKFLQVLTTIMLWLGFLTMILLGSLKIADGKGYSNPVMANFRELPKFLGVGIASLMCQHCLPSILTPVIDKRRAKYVLLSDILSVTALNFMTCMTAVYAFPENRIEDLYTLNFTTPVVLKYILRIFPVFTISTNVPIIGITLRENLATLFLTGNESKQCEVTLRRFILPLVTVIPPIMIAFCTYDIELLVSITGAYPGAVLQYVIPAALVYIGRKEMKKMSERHAELGDNIYRSPFASDFWIYFIFIWYIMSLISVTIRFSISM